jgi:hypothetical protein
MERCRAPRGSVPATRSAEEVRKNKRGKRPTTKTTNRRGACPQSGGGAERGATGQLAQRKRLHREPARRIGGPGPCA